MEIIIKKTKRKDKKFEASADGKTVRFGSTGYQDYTMHKDPERKNRYIARHKNNEDWGKTGVMTAGYLSRFVLWNKPTIASSIEDLDRKYRDIKFKYVA